jgi:hypothetical protein
MDTHVRIDAQDATIELVGPHTYVDGDLAPVPTGKVGLVIRAQGDTVLVVGTPQQLRQHVLDGLTLPVPADVPLFDEVDQ